jgi:hypothetical protein
LFGRSSALEVLSAAAKASPPRKPAPASRSFILPHPLLRQLHPPERREKRRKRRHQGNKQRTSRHVLGQPGGCRKLRPGRGESPPATRLAPVTPGFPGLPEPQDLPEAPGGFFDSTASCPPDLRAAYVERVIAMAKERGVTVAGSLSTQTNEMCVVNSRECRPISLRRWRH